MGLLFRCTTCHKEMVLESYHRGRNVRCPHCAERNDIPDRIDFEGIRKDSVRDMDRGGWLLPLSLAAAILCCLPASAFTWFYASGLIIKARDAEREIEPTLVWAKWISIVGTVIALVAWGLAGAKAMFG